MVKNQKSTLLLTYAVAFGFCCAGGIAHAADPFTLTSSTFKDGGKLQKKNAGNRAGSPNCVGENVSPQFTWTNAPAGINSFALTMVDPEGRGGAGVFHWVAYGIPASVTAFAEGETSKDSDKYVGGKSSQGVGHYSGPCTGPVSPHHYTFIIIATDLDAKALPPGLTYQDLHAKLAGHTKATAGMIGLWTKLWN